ncbi:MAG: hypothetical protein R2706_08685 [Acidimicrobiales bacterium]
MTSSRLCAVLVGFALLGAGCGKGDEATVATTAATTTAESTPTTAAETTTTTESTPTTAAETTTTTESTPTSVGLEQPAIWPAPSVAFDTPEAAASDFITNVFGVPSELGDFMSGDARSGEIEVLPPAETNGSGTNRSLLLMRQLGPPTLVCCSQPSTT